MEETLTATSPERRPTGLSAPASYLTFPLFSIPADVALN